MPDGYVPKPGDIVHMVDDGTETGHEQKGRRYHLIISNERHNNVTGLVLACPLTTNTSAHDYKVKITLNSKDSAVICHHVRAMDFKARDCCYETTVSRVVLQNVISLVKLIMTV